MLCLGLEPTEWKIVQSVNCKLVRGELSPSADAQQSAPSLEHKPWDFPANATLVLSGPRSLLRLWCLSVPTCRGETFFLLCKEVEMFTLLLDVGKHTYAWMCMYVYICSIYIYTYIYLHTKCLVLQDLFCSGIESRNSRFGGFLHFWSRHKSCLILISYFSGPKSSSIYLQISCIVWWGVFWVPKQLP